MQATLVLLAAGVGSRFGGLKQLVPVGPGGSPLMDYTIYDALRAGFRRIVLVVRRETEALFGEYLKRGPGRRTDVRLVHQELDSLPPGFEVPEDRTKPWGTGHAVLVAADAISGPFVVVNADDYYGREGLVAISEFLTQSPSTVDGREQWAMVGYRLGNTLPNAGTVSRGLCRLDEQGRLAGLHEILKISRSGDHAVWTGDDGAARRQSLDDLVSMNLWGFTPSFMGRLKAGFERFLASNPARTTEFLLPDAVSEAIAADEAEVRVLSSESRWFGMTSPEDRATVERELATLVDDGVYPYDLWAH